MTPAGLPHSDISGSMRVCRSPELFAAYHVLHRLLVPRHPPCALSSLTEPSVLARRLPISFHMWLSKTRRGISPACRSAIAKIALGDTWAEAPAARCRRLP